MLAACGKPLRLLISSEPFLKPEPGNNKSEHIIKKMCSDLSFLFCGKIRFCRLDGQLTMMDTPLGMTVTEDSGPVILRAVSMASSGVRA